MRYIPLVALLLCQTIAIGAEELPAFTTQVTPYNAPPIILAQEEDEECGDNTSEAKCIAAPSCTWTDGECVDVDDLDVDDLNDDDDDVKDEDE